MLGIQSERYQLLVDLKQAYDIINLYYLLQNHRAKLWIAMEELDFPKEKNELS